MAKSNIEGQWSSGVMNDEWTTVYDPENPPSLTIIETIADHEDVDPTELDLILYDYVHPDALDTVVESEEVEVMVSIEQYEIQVVDADVIKISV